MRLMQEEEHLFIVNKVDADEEGAARHRKLGGFGTKRFYDNPNEEDSLGACGEAAFSCLTGLPMRKAKDWVGGKGDDGIDFTFMHQGHAINVDVKAAKKPYYLLLKEIEETNKAHILVLSGVVLFKGEYWTRLYGWAYKEELLKQPLRDFGYGIRSHSLKRELLEKMDNLCQHIRRGNEACASG